MAKTSCVLLTAVLLASCAELADLPRGKVQEPSTFAAAKTFAAVQVDAAQWPSRQWWTQFQDPALDALIADALRGNPSLDAAAARLRKAQSQADLAGAALAPQVTATGSATRERLSERYNTPPPYGGSWQWQNQALLNGTYTLDLWGRNRAAADAAVGQARAAAVDSLAAELILTTSIARAYVQFARACEQFDLAQATLDARQKVFDLVRNRVAAGLDSQVELKQAQAGVPAAREQIAQWRENVDLARHQLAALAGQGPDVGADLPTPRLAMISGRAILPSALPAELIGRRPDVIAPRLRVEAAMRDVDSAKAAFYPNIDLTAFAGFQSLGLSNFITGGSAVAGIGPAISLPIFNGGKTRATLAGNTADADAAVAAYQQAVVTALQEIADELASMRSVAAQTAEQAAAVMVLQESYDLAVLRYKEGVGTYLQVLTAETQLLVQKTLGADLRARDLDLTVALVRSLGGGLETLSDGTRLADVMARPAAYISSAEAKP